MSGTKRKEDEEMNVYCTRTIRRKDSEDDREDEDKDDQPQAHDVLLGPFGNLFVYLFILVLSILFISVWPLILKDGSISSIHRYYIVHMLTCRCLFIPQNNIVMAAPLSKLPVNFLFGDYPKLASYLPISCIKGTKPKHFLY